VRACVTLERLHRPEDAERVGLPALARSFGHEPPKVYPIDLVRVGGEPKGYFVVQDQVVIYPALHPGLLSPRETLEVFRHASRAYRQRYGDPYLRLDASYGPDGPTPEKMERLGLAAVHKQFYAFQKEF
jgi:hypothetical protein